MASSLISSTAFSSTSSALHLKPSTSQLGFGKVSRNVAFSNSKQLKFVVKSTVEEEVPTDEDMMNVGLDDVFNLLEKAESLDPEPENLTSKEMNRNLKSTPFSRWYKVYGRSAPADVDARSLFYGPKRPLWKGSNTKPTDVPAHLQGEYAGDYGCDFLGLCADKEKFAKFRAQELLNGRWAMLGVAGCIFPELVGQKSPGFEPVWFKTGAQIFTEEGIDYLGNPTLINAHSLVAVIAFQVVLLGIAELARFQKSKSNDFDSLYPGGLAFDPLGLANDSENFAELQVKEIKNGRLAMLAMAGLFAQGAVTNEGPIANLYSVLKL